MLYLDFHRDDYVMVGDVRIRYLRNKGRDSLAIEVTAPEGIKVIRGTPNVNTTAHGTLDGTLAEPPTLSTETHQSDSETYPTKTFTKNAIKSTAKTPNNNSAKHPA